MVRRGTYSIVARDPQTGELGVAVQSHWFAVGPIVPWVRAGVGAVATQSIAEPAYGPRALDALAGGARAHGALDAAGGRRRAGALPAGRGGRRARQRHCPYRRRLHRPRRPRGRPRVQRPGQHDGLAGGVAGHGARLRRRRRAARPGACSPRCTPPRAAAATRARAPVVRRFVVAPAHGEPWQRDGRPARRRPARAAGRARSPARPLQRLRAGPPRATTSWARAATRRRGSATAAPVRWRPATLTSCSSGPGWPPRRRATCRPHLQRVREAIRLQPGWHELLGRLDPEIAPGAPAVLAALEAAAARNGTPVLQTVVYATISASFVASTNFVPSLRRLNPHMSAAAPSTLEGTWALDKLHSTASFAVKHMVVSTFQTTFKEIDATFEVDGDEIALTGHRPGRVDRHRPARLPRPPDVRRVLRRRQHAEHRVPLDVG